MKTTILILIAMLGVGGFVALGLVVLTKATLRMLASVAGLVTAGGLLVWLAFTGAGPVALSFGLAVVIALAVVALLSWIAYGEAIDERARLLRDAHRLAAAGELMTAAGPKHRARGRHRGRVAA